MILAIFFLSLTGCGKEDSNKKILIFEEKEYMTKYYIYPKTFQKYNEDYFSILVDIEHPEYSRKPMSDKKIVTDARTFEFQKFKFRDWQLKTEQTSNFYPFGDNEQAKAIFQYCLKKLYPNVAAPMEDTCVLELDEVKVYVKKGSFKRTDGGGYVDAAMEFECDLIVEDIVHNRKREFHADFLAKGMAIMRYDDGKSDTTEVADLLYNAISEKILYRRDFKF